jgi:hypothetical protein
MRSFCVALFLHLIGKSMLIVAHDMTALGVEIPARITSGTTSRNFLLCWALLSLAFLPLWPSGVTGSIRISLPFPSQWKMDSGWDPKGQTTTVAAPIRIRRQHFPMSLRGLMIPGRIFLAGLTGWLQHDSMVRHARPTHVAGLPSLGYYFLCCLQQIMEH